ncbi:MAG: insulinase family protein [Deltaproteobacteria bacterium]|nr:insulinase family protein [Deltaproteobacteria bacterium]
MAARRGARRTDLESGVTVVSEVRPGVESTCLGLYFPTGSRHETPQINGISHLIEHLVFKGTHKRSAEQINREIDLLGGASNAYTSKETLCLHGRVLSRHLGRIFDLFADMAVDALPAGLEREVELEREVILSEIAAVEDSPEDLVGDLCDEIYFGDHPLALPVAGSATAVARLDLGRIRDHFRSHIVARDMVVAAAGKLEHDELVALAEERLETLPSGDARARGDAPALLSGTRVLERDLEQVQVCLSARGLSRSDPRRMAAEVFSGVLGDGVSSRLFREVRDRRGLAYSVGSSLSSYVDTGSLNIHFGVSPDKLDETLQVVGEVLRQLRADGAQDSELEAAKIHLHDGSVLSYEMPGARMSYLADNVMLGLDYLDVEHELAMIEAVELRDVNALAAELLEPPLALAVVGPVDAGRLPADGFEIPSGRIA